MSPDQLFQKTHERFPQFKNASYEQIYEGGSDRQFYRIKNEEELSCIAIYYSNERAENKHYAEHAAFLKKQCLQVPQVMGHAPEEQLIWLQDLGEKNLWSQREEPWALRRPLYELTLIEAARLHRIPLETPWKEGLTLQSEFDEKLYQWEQDYFLENALGGLFGIDEQTRKELASSKELHGLARDLATLPRQLIHRDLQSQNIILFEERAWLIDFQGMRAGLAPYDLASLLCDPYVAITASEREELLDFYLQEMNNNGFRFSFDFKKVFWQCAAQRLMQALGAYGFLSLHRGKPHFRNYVTPALARLREVLKNLHPEDRLEDLEKLLEPVFKVAAADERQGVSGAQQKSVLKVLDRASTGATKPFAAAVDCENRFLNFINP